MIAGKRTTAAALACALVAAVVASAVASPPRETVPPRLRQLLSGARLVVAGKVTGVETFDSGRLAVATIAPARTLKGDAPAGTLQVLELRSLPSTPPVFTAGDEVLAFLGPAPHTSYVRKTVPAGSYLQATTGRASVLASTDQPAVEQAAALVGRMADASRAPEPDMAKRAATARALVFDELGAMLPAVVEDGIAGLGELQPLRPLSDEERARLAALVAREDLPARVRERLFAQVAALGITGMIPALRAVQSSDAAVTAAAWQALRRLGAAPDAEQIALRLRSSDPAERTAAARELLARDTSSKELERAGRLALDDPDAKVRQAVIEALAQSGSPATLVVLEKAFGDPVWEVRQGAGRAIFQIGGRPAAESLARLTFTASPEMQRYAVTLLRASGIANDDPLLVRIRNEHPDAEVRETAEHGLPTPEH